MGAFLDAAAADVAKLAGDGEHSERITWRPAGGDQDDAFEVDGVVERMADVIEQGVDGDRVMSSALLTIPVAEFDGREPPAPEDGATFDDRRWTATEKKDEAGAFLVTVNRWVKKRTGKASQRG